MKNIAQTQSFTDLIDFGYIYIDKTEQIFNLLKNRRAFISRPRRFGKSLMLDTVGTLFESELSLISKALGFMISGQKGNILF